MKIKIIFPMLLAAVTTACPSTVEGGPGSDVGGQGTISGRALDVQGKPIAGALVWIKPAVTTGLLTAYTDAQGRYLVKNLPELPYKVYAWAQPEVNGKRHCLRLGHDSIGDYDPVYPGAVRNFRWKLQGVIPDRGNDTFFGGEIRLMPVFRHDGDWRSSDNLKVTVTLVPNGALADGSAGRTITKVIDWNEEHFLFDVPVGAYTATATLTAGGGAPTPLEIGRTDSSVAAQSNFEFEPISASCGGGFGNGTTRGFLYIAVP